MYRNKASDLYSATLTTCRFTGPPEAHKAADFQTMSGKNQRGDGPDSPNDDIVKQKNAHMLDYFLDIEHLHSSSLDFKRSGRSERTKGGFIKIFVKG